MWQQPAITQAFASVADVRPGVMLLKFATNEVRQVALGGRKGLTRTKLGLDEDLTPAQ
jgi:hypothetical protein